MRKEQRRRYALLLGFLIFALLTLAPQSAAPVMGVLSVYAEPAQLRVSDEEKAGFAKTGNPFELQSFVQMYEADELKVSFTEQVKPSVSGNDLHITAVNKQLTKTPITIKKLYDFGTLPAEGGDGKRINRVMIDAVGKRMTNTHIRLYKDEDEEPFVDTKIKMDSEEESWNLISPVFVEVPDSIYGEHYITVEIEDLTTKGSKETEVVLRSIKFYKESVPTVYINIDEDIVSIAEMNGDYEHNVKCFGNMTITLPEGYQSPYGDASALVDTAKTHRLEYIKGRGNSTWNAEKKPYKIKLDSSEDLFGMGKNKHWALIANYYDNSLIRNRITYYLGEKMGFEYTPRLVPVDVVMNGQYLGSYYLSEVVRVGKTRVNIDDMEYLKDEEDFASDDWMTGGFLLGVSPYGKEEGYQFETENGIKFVLESPETMEDPEKLNEACEYIEGYMAKIEEALFNEDFKDKDGKSYQEYLDLESAAKYYLIQEFTNNGDAYGTASTKLYKKKNGKLYFGPLWDFDYVAWGSYDYEKTQPTTEGRGVNFAWFERMKSDPEFVQAVRDAWDELRPELLELIKDGGLIDQYEAELTLSAENNFDVPYITAFDYERMFEEQKNNPDYKSEDGPSIILCDNYKKEIERLKNWIKARLEWEDEYMTRFQDDAHICRVSFYDGDTLLDQYLTGSGEITRMPEVAEREGYYFTGWYGDVIMYEYPHEEGEEEIEIDENSEIEPVEVVTEQRFILGDMFESDNLVLHAKFEKCEDVVVPESLDVFNETIYMHMGDSVRLNASVSPAGADDRLFFEISDPSLIRVAWNTYIQSDYRTGTATLKIKTINGKEKTITVHVVDFNEELPQVYDIGFEDTEITINKGEWIKPGIFIKPEGSVLSEFTILNSNPEAAYMSDSGILYAYERGESTVTLLKSGNGLLSTSLHVIVTDLEADEAEEKAAQQAQKQREQEEKERQDKEKKQSEQISNQAKELAEKENRIKALESAVTEAQKAAAPSEDAILKKDTIFTDNGVKYRVTKPCVIIDGKITDGILEVYGVEKSVKKSAKTIEIPDTVTMNQNTFTVAAVKSDAFKNCKKLEKVTLGSGVVKIGSRAFMGSKKLKSITIKGKVSTIGKNAFKKLHAKVAIYATDDSLAKVRKAAGKDGVKKKAVKNLGI